jgi:MFS family permease
MKPRQGFILDAVISKTTLPLYLTATATSLFGNAAIAIVLPWLVLERTGNPALAGTVAAVSALPSAIAAFVGGHLIDQVGRRRMAVLSDAGSALAVAGLALVDAVFGLDVGWFIALGVLGALFDVPGMTARDTLMANVAEASGVGLDKIASLRGALFGVSFLVGPAAAGGLLAVLPSIQVVWVTAACSGLAALAIGVMPLVRTPAPPQDDASPLAGWTHIRRSRPLVSMLIVSLGSMLLVGPLLNVILPAHFTKLAAPALLGVSLSAYAVGSIAGSGLYGWAFTGRRWTAWVVANLLYVVSAVLIATLNGFWLVAAGMLVAGLGSGMLSPITTVVMTEQVPDALRGRVFGTYVALVMVVSPVGLSGMALILSGADLSAGAWTLAAGWVLVAAFALVAPGLRDYIRPQQGAADADVRHAG